MPDPGVQVREDLAYTFERIVCDAFRWFATAFTDS